MSSTGRCPQCGTLLFSDAAAGLCPRCLSSVGLAPGDQEEPLVPAGLHRLGDYELIGEIARGGMGVVYKARQVSLDRTIALKVVLHGPFSSPEFVKRFHTEAAVVARLQHPNIVAIHEVGQHGGDHFFSMEYVEGRNLADLVRQNPLPARRAATYVKTIAEAVDYAHRRGVLHRDLKPSNVLVDAADQPRITDFGLAKLINSDAELTSTGQVLGSPSYISPEQAKGKAGEFGPEGDVYSLGAILYHLLTGRPPFQGETVQEVLFQVQNVDPVSPRRLNPSVPVDLQIICLKCLRKEPSRRYASAKELAEDLGRFLANKPVRARAVTPAEKVWLWCKRRPVLAALIAALHLVLGLGILGVLWQWQRAEQNALGEREQRRAAENYAARVRLNLYAGEVSFAARELDRGNLGQARRTLAALRPLPGEEDLRGFEWRYLWDQCQGDQLAILGSHDWIVTCAAFSPDGALLATGSEDHTVKIWDVAKRELVTTIAAATGAVWTVAFTPDAKFLVTSGADGTRLWNRGSWQFVANFPGQTASLSKTGSLLATAEVAFFYWWQPPGAVSLWDYSTGKKVLELPKPGRAIAFSPDGKTLAVSSHPNGIDLWDVASGQIQRTLIASNVTSSLTFSPDGNQLLALGGNDLPTLYDLRPNGMTRRLATHAMHVWSASFSPDGKTIATTSSDQTLRLTDANTLQTRAILHGHEHEVWCVAFSPDGKLMATGGKDCKVMLWSGEHREPRRTVPSRGGRPFFSRDGKFLVATSPARLRSQIWNLDNLNEDESPQVLPQRRAMGYAADGRRFVRWARGGKALEVVAGDSTNAIRVPLEGRDEKSKGVQYQGFTPDWKSFFVVDDSGQVGIWDPETGRLRKRINGPPPPVSAGAISPDAHYLAIGAQQENVIHLYDCQSDQEWKLEGHKDTVRGLAFSPDGSILASGSLDGTIRLWKTTNGEAIATLPGHMEETSDVAFSPDGRTLASVNVEVSVKLWHVATRRQLVSWEFPQAGEFIQFSPDGRFLAVTTQTHSIQLFEAPGPSALAVTEQ